MIHLDFAAVHRLATVGSLIEPLRRAFVSTVETPDRAHYELGGSEAPRTLLLMPAWQPQHGVGVKIATIFPANAALGLPSVNASYLLLSGQTGEPRAFIDGRALTLLRTAAVSALAADALAPQTAEVLLMVGTGALARYLIEGHTAVRRYRSVQLWGRDAAKAAALAAELNSRGFSVTVAEELERSARCADVISCATLAERPLIRGAWLKAACHLDLVGSFKPGMREADDDCSRGAFIAVDTLTALTESGDLVDPLAGGIISREDIRTLSELIERPAQVRPAATRPGGRTLFKSVGTALADLAAAETLYQRHGADPASR